MEYWAIINGEKIGPVSIEVLAGYNITSDTQVWHAGLAQWVAAHDVAELQNIIKPSYAPGQQIPGATPRLTTPQCPPNYLPWAIIVTLLCFQVTGIVAIVYSAQVESRYRSGDYYGALSASKSARNWIIASVAIPALGGLAYLLLMAVPILLRVLF